MSKPIILNRDAAKWNPEAVFEHPNDIAEHKLLTRAEKLTALERWRVNILTELAAVGEGMATRGLSSGRLKVLEAVEAAKANLAPRARQE